MSIQPLPIPALDPSPLFELFRGSYATEVLVSAVAHFNVFSILATAPMALERLRERLELDARAFSVLTTALRAMDLLDATPDGEIGLTPLARNHLLPGTEFFVGEYFAQHADAPGVLEMTRRLRSSKPAGHEDNKPAEFIYREGIDSAMEQDDLARNLTLRLSGRAKNVAPVLAQNLPLPGANVLLDVGGGSGIYAIAYLRKHSTLQAIVWDRPAVLKVAKEFAEHYGVADRIRLVPGDMFADPIPSGCDAILLSNVLHDWDVPQCGQLIGRCAAALPAKGRLLVHDVFLNDDLSGPLPIALYSAALFCLTEGRAYSAVEYRRWLEDAGLKAAPPVPTLIHCGVIEAIKGSCGE